MQKFKIYTVEYYYNLRAQLNIIIIYKKHEKRFIYDY